MVQDAKTKNFYSYVDPKVNSTFGKQWRKRKQEKNQATTGALRLWLKLPKEVQAILISWPDLEIQRIADALSRDLKLALRQALVREEQYRKNEVEDSSESA